jgi:hypothetical protein
LVNVEPATVQTGKEGFVMTSRLAAEKLKEHQSAIARVGKVEVNQPTYLKQNEEILSANAKRIPPSSTIAANLLQKASHPNPSPALVRLTRQGLVTPKSITVAVGEAPDGFGKQVLWDATDGELSAVIFLNAGDDRGVMISGVQESDTIEFLSSTGIASFAENTQNKYAGAVIGIVGAGATVAAGVFGVPEFTPLIGPAVEFAKSQFGEETKVKSKRRDPFGVDPGTRDLARQEGGVIISMPDAGCCFYSGASEKFWIQKPGARIPRNYPAHVKGAFFLTPGGTNIHTANTAGDIIIYPWDWKFEDNFGFYRLHVLLKRGTHH